MWTGGVLVQESTESLLCYTADTTSAKASTLKHNNITVTIMLQMKTMQGECKLVQSKLLYINPVSLTTLTLITLMNSMIK